MHTDYKMLATLALCGTLATSCRPQQDKPPTAPRDPLLTHASSIAAGEHHTLTTARSLRAVSGGLSALAPDTSDAPITRLLGHYSSTLGVSAPTSLDAWSAAGVDVNKPLTLARYGDAHVLVLPLTDHNRWRAHMSTHTGRPVAALDDFAPHAYQAGDELVWMFDGEHIFLTHEAWIDITYLLCRRCQNVPLPALAHDTTYMSFARNLADNGHVIGAYMNSSRITTPTNWDSIGLAEDARRLLTWTSSPSLSVGASDGGVTISASVTNPIFRGLLAPSSPSLSLDAIAATSPSAMLRVSANKHRAMPLLGHLSRDRQEFFELNAWLSEQLTSSRRSLQEIVLESWTGEVYLAAYDNQSGLGQTTWDAGKTSALAALVFEDSATVQQLEQLWLAYLGGPDDVTGRENLIIESASGQIEAVLYTSQEHGAQAPPNIFFVGDRILIAGGEVPAEAITQWASAARQQDTSHQSHGAGSIDFDALADTAKLLLDTRDAALLSAPSSPASVDLTSHGDTIAIHMTLTDAIDLGPSAHAALNDVLLEEIRDEYYDVFEEIEHECTAHLDSLRGGVDDPTSSEITWEPMIESEPTPSAPLSFPGGTSYTLASTDSIPTGGEARAITIPASASFIPSAFSTRARALMRYTYETGQDDGAYATVTLRAEADLDPETAETFKVEQVLTIDPETNTLVASPILESPEF